MSLELVLQILMLLPPLPIGTQPAPPAQHVEGSGTLMISGCQPGDAILIEPGRIQAAADKDGVVMVQAPAQGSTEDAYRFLSPRGSGTFNGTLSPRQSLIASCP